FAGRVETLCGTFLRVHASESRTMKSATKLVRAIASLMMTGALACSASAQFEELVTKTPSTANSLALVNIEKIMSSAAAVKGNWKTEHANPYAAGITFLPPDTKMAILAAQYDFEMMHPVWQVAAMELDHEASLPLVEKLTGG